MEGPVVKMTGSWVSLLLNFSMLRFRPWLREIGPSLLHTRATLLI